MAISRLAARMISLALVLFALARFSSPGLTGWLIFAAVAPGLLVSPVGGTVLDRVGPTAAVRIDLVASALFIALLATASRIGWASTPFLFVLVTLFSLTGPLGAAGVRTLLFRLVPTAALDRANGIDTAIWAFVDVLGPALAGLAVARLGPESTMLLVAVVYAGAVLCLLNVPHLPGLGSRRTSLLWQVVEGVTVVVRQPTLRGLAITYSLYQITWGVLIVAVPVVAANHFPAQAARSATGFLWAAVGGAGCLGALIAGHLRTSGRERHIMAAGMVVTALAAWPVAAEFGLEGLAIGLMLAGVTAGPIDVALLTLRQRRTDPRQLGRVLSISMSLNQVGFPVGSALAGMLIDTSLTGTFVLAALASVLAAVATASIPRDRAQCG